MGLTAASKAAIIGEAVAVPVAATVINLRNKQRADSAQLQEQAQQRPQLTPLNNGQPQTFCVQAGRSRQVHYLADDLPGYAYAVGFESTKDPGLRNLLLLSSPQPHSLAFAVAVTEWSRWHSHRAKAPVFGRDTRVCQRLGKVLAVVRRAVRDVPKSQRRVPKNIGRARRLGALPEFQLTRRMLADGCA